MLELVGFEEAMIPLDEGYPEPVMLIDETRLDTRELSHVAMILDEVINSGSCRVIADKLGIVIPEIKKT